MSARLFIKAQPGAHKNEVKSYQDGVLRISITAPPVDGKANQAIIDFLAELLSVPKSDIVIQMGFGGRNKIVEILGILPHDLDEKIKSLLPVKKGTK